MEGKVQAIDRLRVGLPIRRSRSTLSGAMAIETGFGSIRLVDPGDGELDRIRPIWRSGLGVRVRVRGATNLATGADSIWVGTGEESRVVQVRPSS